MAKPEKVDPYALRAERKAKDKEAGIAAAKLRNPPGPQNQPGSGQLTPNVYAMPAIPRAWQLPQRTASATSGPIGVANPPPVGNQASQRVTTVQLASRARNPYGLASGRGTTADAERWQRENGGSISSRIYTPTTSNAPTPGREALFDAAMSPEAQAQKAQQTADNDMMRIEQQYGTPTWQKTGENTYGAVKTMTPHQEPGSARQAAPAANWQQSVTQKHKAIGQAGSPENAAYVAAYKAKKAAGEDFDPSALADEIMQQIESFSRFAQAPTADPTVAPTASATPPGTGRPSAYTPTTPAKPNNTIYQDYRDQQAREVEQATADVEAAQARDDAKLAAPQGVEIAPATSGEIGAPKPRPAKYGTTPNRPNGLKINPYS